MEKTIKARFKGGILEPLEKLELNEGEELRITISTISESDKAIEAIKVKAGAWKDSIDCDQLLKDIYESRRLSAKRPAVKL